MASINDQRLIWLLGAVNSDHRLGFFGGATLQAIIETSVADLEQRAAILFLRPITDASACFGSIGKQDTSSQAVVYSLEQPMNKQGLIPQRVETRYARARLRIAAGVRWVFARGFHSPDLVPNQGDR